MSNYGQTMAEKIIANMELSRCDTPASVVRILME